MVAVRLAAYAGIGAAQCRTPVQQQSGQQLKSVCCLPLLLYAQAVG